MSQANDDLRAVPELTVSVVRFVRGGSTNDPTQVSLFGTVANGCGDFGVLPGGEVEIRMDEYPRDCDRLLADLMRGSPEYGVPECGKGSVVLFMSCSTRLGDGAIQTASYEVIKAVPNAAPPAAHRFGAEAGGPAHRLWPEILGAEAGGPAHRLR